MIPDTDLFAIPLSASRHLVYAPAAAAAFVANVALVNALADLRSGRSVEPDRTDGTVRRFLREVGILGGGPVADEAVPPRPVRLILVLSRLGASGYRCRSWPAHDDEEVPDGSGCMLDAAAGERLVSRAFERALRRSGAGVEVRFECGVLTAEVLEVIGRMATAARRRAISDGVALTVSAAIEGRAGGEVPSRLLTGLDALEVHVRLSADALGRATRDGLIEDALLSRLGSLRGEGVETRVVLVVEFGALSLLPDAIEQVCARLGRTQVEIRPDFPFGPWRGSPGPEAVEFLAAIREARARVSRVGADVDVHGIDPAVPTNLCGTARDTLRMLPGGALAECCESERDPGRPARARETADDVGEALGTRARRLFCTGCFARPSCLGDCFRAAPESAHQEFAGSDWCHVVRELTRDRLLSGIADGDGLVWRGAHAAGADPWPSAAGTDGRADVAPQFRLRRLSSLEAGEPGIFPVLGRPWDPRLTRRAFLGLSLGLALVLTMLDQSRGRGAHAGVPPVVPRPWPPVTPPAVAATWVDPRRLSAIGIEAAPGDSIEPGYRARWFIGPDLEPPRQAFPPDESRIAEFANAEDAKPLDFAWPKSEVKPGSQRNGGVPPAFLVYRRAHHEDFKHRLDVAQSLITQLRGTGQAVSGVDGVKLAFARRSPRPPGPRVPRYSWPTPVTEWPEGPGGAAAPDWARYDSEVVVVSFAHQPAGPAASAAPRPVHLVELGFRRDLLRSAGEVAIEAYADDDPEPVRRETVGPSTGITPLVVILRFVQGHYDRLMIVARRAIPFGLRFTFMDEDMRVAADPEQPGPGEWAAVASIPFITAFSAWASAKEEHFRHALMNRYLNFQEAGAPTSGDRLDFKYEPLFARLQQAFVRLWYARQIDLRYLRSGGKASLAEMEYEPHLFVQLWSLDPIVATLFGLYYADVPGEHNPRPPTLGTAYDYLVTTAWPAPAKRLGYIVQNVSRQTTPAVPTPTSLQGGQIEGIARDGRRVLYQVGLEWSPGAGAGAADQGPYDAPLFDVRRQVDGETGFALLTHRYDAGEVDPDERFVDSPIQATVSQPYPETAAERADFTSTQLAALDALDALQAADGEAVLTAEQEAAYREMSTTPTDRFFRIPDGPVRYSEWLPAPPPKTESRIRYDVRAVDLFGRTSPWHGPREVVVKHEAPPPEAGDVRAILARDGQGRDVLRVSWRLGGREWSSGSPVDHFNVVARVVDARRDLVRMLYNDLLTAPSAASVVEPTNAEMAGGLAILDDPGKTRADLIVSVCRDSRYRARWTTAGMTAAQQRAALVAGLYSDLVKREPTPEEAQQAVALLGSGLDPEPVVGALLGSSEYVPPNPRRFRYWREHIVNPAPIAAEPPIEITASTVSPVAGTEVAGTIVAVSAESGPAARAEQARWLGDSRVLAITTDQTFSGLLPFVALPRYHAAGALLDTLEMKLGDAWYPVVGIENGGALRVSVALPASGGPPESALAPGAPCVLRLTVVREHFAWQQQLGALHLPDLELDAELAAVSAVADRVTALADRASVTLRISDAPAVDVTGREAWFTNGAWFEYEHDGKGHRVPILDFATIRFDADALRFGKVQVAGPTPPAMVVTLTNGGSTRLLVTWVTSTHTAFSVVTPPASATVGPGGALSIEVRFSPTAAGPVTGVLQVDTEDVGRFSLGLAGEGVPNATDESPDARAAAPRHFLAEVTLGQVVLEADVEDDVENPAPVFPQSLLEAALNAPLSKPCEIRVPALRRLEVVAQTPADGARLRGVAGGELAFTRVVRSVEQEAVCDLVTRPWGPSGSASVTFLIRQEPALPEEPSEPRPGDRCVVYPIYRAEFPLEAPLPQPAPSPQTLSVAVSVHDKPRAAGSTPSAWYPGDAQQALVASPDRVRVAAKPPVAPQVVPPQVKEPWEDPFGVVYASLPKVLDNRRVVQAKLDLGNAEVMKGAPLSFPADGELELFRAPEDALRVLTLEHMRLPIPPDAQNDPDLGQFDNLSPEARYSEVFALFNGMTPEERYRVMASRLLRYWDHAAYSLRAAFRPVGKVPRPEAFQGPPHFIEELEGVAGGNVFYAVRTVHDGAAPTPLQLLPFRVGVLGIEAPPPPKAWWVPHSGGVVLQWDADADTHCDGYEIRRSPAELGPVPVMVMNQIARFDKAAARTAPREHFAPLRVTRESRPLQAADGKIGPWFPEGPFIAVRGVYLRDGFDLAILPLIAQAGTNYYDEAGGSSYDSATAQIANVPVPNSPDGGRQRLVLVYAYGRAAFGEPGNGVSSGTLLLPLVRTVLGVFIDGRFDPARRPLLEQDSPNLFTADTVHVGHHIARLDVATGTRVTVVYDDDRLGSSYIANLPVARGRVFLPFGDAVRAIRQVFRADDRAEQNNLLDTGVQVDLARAVITGLSVPDGTTLRVHTTVENLVWRDTATHTAVVLPTLASGRRVVAVVAEPPAGFDVNDAAAVAERNRLPSSHVIKGRFLLFPSDLPSNTRVGLVMEDGSGARSLVDWDDRTYQFVDHPERASGYRIVCRRTARAAGEPITLRSSSGVLLPGPLEA